MRLVEVHHVVMVRFKQFFLSFQNLKRGGKLQLTTLGDPVGCRLPPSRPCSACLDFFSAEQISAVEPCIVEMKSEPFVVEQGRFGWNPGFGYRSIW